MTETAQQIGTVVRALQVDAAALLSSLQTTLPSETDAFDAPKAPSLLNLKNVALLSYLQHLVLLTSSRLRGRSLDGNEDGTGEQGQASLLVRNLIELRLVLEKVRPLESKTRTLIDRLLRAADEDDKRIREGRADDEQASSNTLDAGGIDPLSFRPNIAAFTAQSRGTKSARSKDEEEDDEHATGSSRDRGDGIYRPPRLAPVAYNNPASGSGRSGGREKAAPRNSALLADLSSSMSANPYETSSGGVGVNGGSGAQASARAKALRRMDQYEEENFTRLGMSKRDAKRRRRDEADVALGGAGLSSKRGRVGAGLEEEFGDLLRNSGGDGLKNVKRKSALQRSREGGGGGEFADVLSGAADTRGSNSKFKRQLGRSRAKAAKRR